VPTRTSWFSIIALNEKGKCVDHFRRQDGEWTCARILFGSSHLVQELGPTDPKEN
jgi:hypothetical protein